MKDMKLSNIQIESEKIKIKKNINEIEDLKAKALLKLGIITFDKIRKNEIQNEEFNELCEEIKNYDIEIYTKYMKLRSFEKENKKVTCECGYVALKNEKFCPQCGRNLMKEEPSYIICPNCEEQIDEDSKFCCCCGSKIEKVQSTYSNSEYISQINIINKENDDIYEKELNEYVVSDKDESVEEEGREFLKHHE